MKPHPDERAVHWDGRYRSIGDDEVSWYQERPSVSLDLLGSLALPLDAPVIDVGGGTSPLVDHLLRRGHRDLTVLDISSVALDTSRARIGDPAEVSWIRHDLLTWPPTRRWGAWHDRAVLHFLVDEPDRATYGSLLRRTLEPGGAFVIGTFAEEGPTQCSDLPVRRSSVSDLVDLLGDVDLTDSRRELHRTPVGGEQAFIWIAGRLRDNP